MLKVAIALLGLISAAASAQDRSEAVEQISDSPATAMPQISADAAGLVTSQLTSGSESEPAEPQLTREHRSPQATQLSARTKATQSPQPISKPADGRRAAVDIVEGEDRCDPAREDRSRRRRCADVIENRAAEFSRPAPTELSPEQRLLLDQEMREGALDTRSATRRLATTGQPDNSLEALGVASIALQATSNQAKKDEKEDAAKAAEAEAIVNAVINQPH